MKRILLAALMALSACASVTDVKQTGPDTYTVSARATAADGSAGEQKAIAIRKASDWCNARGLQMKLGVARTTEAAPGADVDFSCVKP